MAGERHTAPASRDSRNVCPPQAGERDRGTEISTPCDACPPAGAVSADLAGQRQGVVGRRELLDAGISKHVIDGRARTGELHRKYRGVYIVGHLALAPRGEEAAALLACGDHSLISGRSAAYLWGLLDKRPDQIHVTLVGRRCRPKPGIRLHFLGRIDDQDIGEVDSLPVTSPARTLIDFAADAEDDELEAALSEARVQKLIKDKDIEKALDRAGTRKGVARMRRLLAHEGEDSGYTRSKAERLMRRLLRAASLPQPVCNARIHGQEPDFLWSAERLVVQVDGYQFHGHRSAFERDRRKDQMLVAAGYRVVRVTWLQLQHEPLRVIAVIAAALTASRAPH
jgi:very-short-patch-repair endonuclease